MKEVRAVIDRFENNLAVLMVDGLKILWPKDKLPKSFHEGEVIVFQILADHEADKDREQRAKDLLNELLKDEEDSETSE
ncbi:MAG: DUF3006 domain-containing protein [Patescibacteria group bacterium]